MRPRRNGRHNVRAQRQTGHSLATRTPPLVLRVGRHLPFPAELRGSSRACGQVSGEPEGRKTRKEIQSTTMSGVSRIWRLPSRLARQ
jgi:hypothetical protein